MNLLSKFFNRYLPLFLSLVLVVLAVFVYLTVRPENKSADAAWYSSSWGYRKPLTIDKNKLSTTATTTFSNFPMLFSVTDSDLKYTSFGGKVGKTDGTDIVFTSSDGSTKLDHEIEKYSSSTGETIIWVRIPTLSAATDTTLYIYFGNSGASDQQNRTGVWDSNYKGVYHLPNGTTLSASDSTNKNNGSNNGVTAGSAQIDGGGVFNGSSTYIEASTSPVVAGTASFTISAWIRTTSYNTVYGKSIYAERAVSGQDIVKLDSTDLNSPNGVFMTYRNSAGSLTQLRGPAIINDNNLHYVVGTLSGGVLNVYVDGKLDASGARNGNDTLTDVGKRAWIGGDYGDSNAYFSGTLDEVRVSGSARSTDWIATEYNNQSSPTTFYAYGSVGIERRTAAGAKVADRGNSGLGWYSSSWGYRKPLTIDKNKLSTTATTTFSNFPMLFSVTDSDLKYTSFGGKVGKTDGTDIVFTSSDGSTKLDHEIEKYSSSTGETIIWVRIPTLSAAADTVLYIYFGNSGASDQQNRTGVWDSNFKGVWHMPNGSALSALDSTSNSNNGTITNALATTGQIDGAAMFDGTDDRIVVTQSASLNDANVKTLSLWVKHNETAFDNLVGKNSGTNVWNMVIDSSNAINFRQVFSGGTGNWTSASVVPVGVWSYVVLSYDRTSATNDPAIYIDGLGSGLASDTNSSGSANSDAANDLYFGETGSGGSDLNGILDEVRFSSTSRSLDWISTEYNNQKSPNTFYSYGAISAFQRQNPSGSAAPTVKIRGGVKFR